MGEYGDVGDQVCHWPTDCSIAQQLLITAPFDNQTGPQRKEGDNW